MVILHSNRRGTKTWSFSFVETRSDHSLGGKTHLHFDLKPGLRLLEQNHCVQSGDFTLYIQSSVNSSQKAKAAGVPMGRWRLKENVEYICNGILLGSIKRRKNVDRSPVVSILHRQPQVGDCTHTTTWLNFEDIIPCIKQTLKEARAMWKVTSH